jgi:lysozyme family protein
MPAFESAFTIIVGHEGSVLDMTRSDTGNWTGGAVGVGKLAGSRYGISAASYPTLDIAALTLAGAAAIYRRDYWAAVRADELPPMLALLVFDAAVNNGVGQAVRWLQIAVDAEPDGHFGPLTMRAVVASMVKGPAGVCIELMAQRTQFMASSSDWKTFGLGWARRLCALPFQACRDMGESP